MLGIVVTYVEQRFIVLPNTAGKKEQCQLMQQECLKPKVMMKAGVTTPLDYNQIGVFIVKR